MKWLHVLLLLLCVYCFSRSRAAENQTNDSLSAEQKILIDAVKGIKLPHLFDFVSRNSKRLFDKVTICTVCVALAKALIAQRKLGGNREFFVDELTSICTTLQVENERVCRGVVESNVDIFMHIIDKHLLLSPVKVCGTILQSFSCPIGFTSSNWDVIVPDGPPAEAKKIKQVKETFTIVHISDIHYDPLYTPGGNVACDEPLCCQVDQPKPTSDKDKCGYWIEYSKSDPPWYLVEAALAQANKHNPTYIYYTGDIISHRVWATSVENNTRDIRQLMGGFEKAFSVPVYNVLGNHEPHPLNEFAPLNVSQELSTVWLFDLVAEEWGKWLPSDTKETIKKGGYYTVSPRPGFRIIALNGNVCYTFNWWLIDDDVDPYDELAWLMRTLAAAEKAGESVHILNHVPSGGGECLKPWSRAYSKILKRFSNIIVGQFVGHTHLDEFQVYYDKEDHNKPFGVNWNGASITTFENNNPSYKVFEVDAESFALIDYEEWTFNVNEANKQNSTPEWYKLYSFKEAYGAKSLEPAEVAEVVERMASNVTLMQQYFEFRSRKAPPALEEGCDTGCKKDLLCDIATSVFGERNKCNDLRTKYQLTSVKDTIKSIFK